MNYNSNLLKYLNLLIPILSGYYVLYGVIFMVSYYDLFNIDIIDYIEFGEIIIYFIKDIFFLLILFIIIIVYSIIASRQIKTVDKNLQEGSLKLKKYDNFFKQFFSDIKSTFFRFIFIPIIFGLTFSLGIIFNKPFLFNLFFVTTMVYIFLIYSYFKNNKVTTFIVVIIISSLFYSYFNARYIAKKLKQNGQSQFNFQYDNRLIKSDSTNFFIGKTKKYLFYYKSKEKKTIVYPVDKIEFINIPDK